MTTTVHQVEMRPRRVTVAPVEAELSTDQQDTLTDDQFLKWVKTQFTRVAGEDHCIDQIKFKQALGIKNSGSLTSRASALWKEGCKVDLQGDNLPEIMNYFAERFFHLFDKGRSGRIDLTDFIDGITLLARGSPTQKLKFMFDAYDVNGNGSIEPDELKTVMQHCMEESDLQLSEEALETLTLALFEHADADGSGVISFEELCTVLAKYPDVMKNLTISAAKWMKPPKAKGSKSSHKPACMIKNYWVNNAKDITWTTIYFIVNIGLFLTCIRYRDFNAAVMIARGCGMCLNFNCAFILVLMLRGTLTWLRMTPLASILPIDNNVTYHRNVGYIIVLLSLVHTVAHYVNVALALGEPEPSTPTTKYWEYVLTLKSGVGYVGPGFGYLSGLILTIILLIMLVCSLPCIRRSGHFEIFYFSHLLYVVFWIMLILHGPIFWYFFILPGIIFILEKTLPPFLRRATGKKFHIKRVTLLPSKVTHLVIHCSGQFQFRPGDYVFIKVPCIAKFEYHPFTISSAPEEEGKFSLHVRSTGHWTQNLFKYFEEFGSDPSGRKSARFSLRAMSAFSARKSKKNRESQIDLWKQKYKTKKVNIQVSIRGPYGTPTREIFDTEHAVLIASGIGVTPYASILQSISHRVRDAKKTCPHCSKTFVDRDNVAGQMKLRKVDFLWINRKQHCFEWFVSLLQQLEEEGEEDSGFDGFLDMCMYMTSALSMSDMKGFGLQMALDAMQNKGQRNVLTGLRSSLKPGRPNWDTVFPDLTSKKKGQVKVFYCGNPALGKILKQYCDRFGFGFSKETF